MARQFSSRFRRIINGVFAGDAAPVGALVVNDPLTGVGTRFNMALVRRMGLPTERIQGYFGATTFAGTLTLQLWCLNATTSEWIQIGTPLAAVPALRMFEASGFILDSDLFVQVTPSVGIGVGEQVILYLEEIDR